MVCSYGLNLSCMWTLASGYVFMNLNCFKAVFHSTAPLQRNSGDPYFVRMLRKYLSCGWFSGCFQHIDADASSLMFYLKHCHHTGKLLVSCWKLLWEHEMKNQGIAETMKWKEINGPVNLLSFHHNRSAHSVVSLVQLLDVKSKLVSRLTITTVECKTKQNTLRICLEEFTSKRPFGWFLLLTEG